MDRPVPSCRPRRRADVAWVEVDGEVVAIDPLHRVHLISSTGSLLWRMLDGDASLQQLADDVAAAFDVDPSAALDDVSEFALHMQRSELIETHDGELR